MTGNHNVDIIIREANQDDFKSIVALYAEAFDDGAAFQYIFQYDRGSKFQKESLVFLFEGRVRLCLNAKVPYLVAIDPSTLGIVGAVACVPKVKRANLWDMIQIGLYEWPFRWGFASLVRALTMHETGAGEEHHPFTAELSMMAVSPAVQGKGIGTKLLGAMIELVGDKETIKLSTQKEENVKFYQKFGFYEIHKNATYGFDNWFMVRPAT